MENEEKKYDARRSLGFTWDLPQGGLGFSRADNPRDALFTFHKYRVEHVSKSLRTLEHIPCTYAQTRSILDGKSTSGLSTRQLRAIENYGKACERLMDMLEEGRFSLSEDSLFELHSLVGKDEARDVGKFRGHEVAIEQSHYMPPRSEYLEGIFKEGASFLNSLEDSQEQAVCTFLFMARSQFFSDCNKRTANLVMNGLLMKAGYQPLSVDSEHFLEKMATFYESADATEIIDEINSIARKQYRSEALEADALAKQRESSYLLSAETVYGDQLKLCLDAKAQQVQRLEERLEKRIASQRSMLETTDRQRPGLLKSLWKGREWKERRENQSKRLQTLENRLSVVKAIKKDMGGKRLEALAEKRLRRHAPDMVARYEAEMQRKRERSAEEHLKRAEERSLSATRGAGLSRKIGY